MTILCAAGAGASLESLPGELSRLASLGYSAAELNPEYLDCIFGGRIQPSQLKRAAAACRPYAAPPGQQPAEGQLALSIHSPAVLDLRHATLPDLHRDILLTTVEFAAAVGARLVVVHFEQRSRSPALEAQFRRGVEAAADLAGRHRIALGIENIEIERAERVLELIDAIDQPHVRLTYDFGHDFLAAAAFGYDHLASVRACAPYAIHAHCSDNFGRFDPARLGDFTLYKAIPQRNLNVSGLGDVHLPVGWGALPYDAAVAAFRDARSAPFDGILLGEHRRAFANADPDVLIDLRRFARLLGEPQAAPPHAAERGD